jgi:hypothetical protein
VTAGWRAAFYLALFLATGGAFAWSQTMPPGLAFVLGLAWGLVLLQLVDPAKEPDRRADILAASVKDGTAEFEALATGLGGSRLEAYKLGHDLLSQATMRCMYGCKDPLTCSLPHANCRHCREVRAADGIIGPAGAR